MALESSLALARPVSAMNLGLHVCRSSSAVMCKVTDNSAITESMYKVLSVGTSLLIAPELKKCR